MTREKTHTKVRPLYRDHVYVQARKRLYKAKHATFIIIANKILYAARRRYVFFCQFFNRQKANRNNTVVLLISTCQYVPVI